MNLVKISRILMVFIFSIVLDTRASANEWRDRWMAEIDNIQNTPLPHRLERLGSAVGAKSTAGGWRPTEDQTTVANRAIALLITIPGHAEYFRDRVLSAQNEVKAHLDDGQTSVKLGEYYNERSRSFETLSHLPSAENVKILGDFLADDWTGNLFIQEGAKVFPLSHDAVRAFGQLPLIGKPFPQTEGYQAAEQLEGWRQWYQEIKSGKRTFRFEGDSTEYDLNGPATEDKVERIAMHQREESKRTAMHGGTERLKSKRDAFTVLEPATSPTGKYALIFAGVVLLAAMFWFFVRDKKGETL